MSNGVALVTGSSSGIGKEIARQLNEDGYKVYGAARRVEQMGDLEVLGCSVLRLDIADEDSIRECVEAVVREEGRLDVLVNNAGYGSYGAVEDVDLSEARRQFEVNLFGLARITQLVLPHMRGQRSGYIFNISSMGGKMYGPMGAWYHATKHALEGFSDCLRLEVQDFGIHVVVIEPGNIATEWGDIAIKQLAEKSGSGPYAAFTRRTQAFMKRSTDGSGSAPTVVSNAILKALEASKPKTRYAVGMGAKPLIFLRTFLPDRAFDKFLGLLMRG